MQPLSFLVGMALGAFGGILVTVALWAASVQSGRHADPETPIEE